MKSGKIHIVLLSLFLALCTNIRAQDYSVIDTMVRHYPASFSSPEELALRISKDFSLPEEKARAIYDWIAFNIRYDIQKYISWDLFSAPYYIHSIIKTEDNYYREDPFRINMAEEAFYTKKTLCEGYASLYKRLCDLTGVECVIIPGYVKLLPGDIGRKPYGPNHSWNAVKIKGRWHLLDVTWGAGLLDYVKKKFIPQYSDIYFFMPPGRFFLQHCPREAHWSFTKKSMEDFIDLPLFYRDYMISNIDILKPNSGILYIHKKTHIKFRIKNLPRGMGIYFSTDAQTSLRKAFITRKAGISNFSVSLNDHSGTYLTLFNENQAIVTYKLVKR